MTLDRPYLKSCARDAMRDKKPSVYLVSFIFIVINYILSNLNVTIQLNNMDIETLTDALMAGEAVMNDIGLWGSLILLAVSIMSSVIAVGYQWYCLCISRGEQAGIGHIFDGFGIFFKVVWLEIVIGFFVFLWSLLLVFPGIIAAFRYSQAFYILLDDPDKGALQCLRESKAMTRGYKWKLFVLDLSFIGWNLLTIVPFVSIFVSPYYGVTRAMYYNSLSGWRKESEPVYEYGPTE